MDETYKYSGSFIEEMSGLHERFIQKYTQRIVDDIVPFFAIKKSGQWWYTIYSVRFFILVALKFEENDIELSMRKALELIFKVPNTFLLAIAQKES